MKKLISILMLGIILISFKTPNAKVLLYIEDNSHDLGFMLTHEVGKMKQILEQNGFKVDIASLTGELLKTDSVTIQPDYRLSEVNIKNYEGFIIPCMATNDSIVTPEERNFVQAVVKINKPLAAQTGAILILAKAGVLDGKKYTFAEENIDGLKEEFKNGIYSGTGVVKDGNIITSAICPMMAKVTGKPDGTTELTNLLVQAMKSQN